MKLAVFTSQFPGPTCTFFARDMRGLIEAGVEIDVFPIYPLDAELWRYVPALLDGTILPRNRIHYLKLNDCVHPFNFRPAKSLQVFLNDAISISGSAIKRGSDSFGKTIYALLKAWTWARQHPNGYDHVLAYWGNYAGTCAYVYHRLCGMKIPFSIFLHANADLYRNPIFMKRKLLHADRIITCSDFNRHYITERFSDVSDIGSKLHVHHHGLNFAELPTRLNARSPGRVIAVGRFVKQKGFEYLLHAAHELKSRGIKFEIELVGDGEEAPLLRSLAHQLDIANLVKFRGWVPADDVPDAISKATVLVHPSPDLGDGVPNVVKEAMAVGTPVIGSMVAGIPELLDHGNYGVLVPPKNITALADAIQTMLADDAGREKYARKARKRSEQKFDLWQNGQRLASVLATTVRKDE
jgi:glycosyltransferase involved in cell wall biosynthesis